MKKIRVLLADDHAILRSGLRLLIQGQDDMEVVGEAGDCAAVVALAGRLRPDVVTLDLSMPGGSGLETIEKLRVAAPSARVVVLTMHEDPAYVHSALAAGASGYLVKSAADQALMEAIRAVHRGRVFIEAGSAAAIASLTRLEAPAPAPLAALSAREREVLVLVARGHTNRAIGERIHLSVKTVESYRARLMHKLGLSNRSEMTRLAIDLGLLKDAPPDPVEE